MLRSALSIGFIFAFAITASAQIPAVNINESYSVINPILLSAFKKPLRANQLLSEYIKPSKYELMYWPNFPLNAAQVEARNREWERKSKQSVGEQIAGDIIKSQINSLIYGKNKPVAVRPKF
ncbi:MAG: hypothetical protein ABI685_03190 [Ferruginibacter sp.]